MNTSLGYKTGSKHTRLLTRMHTYADVHIIWLTMINYWAHNLLHSLIQSNSMMTPALSRQKHMMTPALSRQKHWWHLRSLGRSTWLVLISYSNTVYCSNNHLNSIYCMYISVTRLSPSRNDNKANLFTPRYFRPVTSTLSPSTNHTSLMT